MTTPHLEPPRTASAPEEPLRPDVTVPSAGDRFFSWTAGLGLLRSDGWIGGVAAGIAARLRIDPLIVRGILVVVGLFGFPVVFLYALAWAVLPDVDGRMPLQDALRRQFEPAQVGIVGLLLLGLIPLGPGLVFVGGVPSWMLSPGLGGWSGLSALLVGVGLVIAAIVLFIILRAARHTARSADPGAPTTQPMASADVEFPDTSAAATGSGPVAAADPQGTDAAGFAASAPALSPDDDAYAAWREQHAAWKAQDDAWRRQQQDAGRAVREQARRERQERAAAFSAEAAERRRIRRLTSPRTPLAYVAVVIGIALLAGTAIALSQQDALAPARGVFVAAIVLGLSMVVGGALRRRSGFLTCATVVTLLAAGAASAVPVVQTLHIGTYWLAVGNTSQPGTSASDPFVQAWGDLVISTPDTGAGGALYVHKTSGNTQILQEPRESAARVEIEITTRDAAAEGVRVDNEGNATAYRLDDIAGVTSDRLPDGRIRYTVASGDPGSRTPQRVVIEQDSGFISLMQPVLTPTTGGSR